jgi:hypothetical protein
LQTLQIASDLRQEKFAGDPAAEVRVLRLVNYTHPATTQLLDDALVRDGLADHWAQILRPRMGRVNEDRRLGRLAASVHEERNIALIDRSLGFSLA